MCNIRQESGAASFQGCLYKNNLEKNKEGVANLFKPNLIGFTPNLNMENVIMVRETVCR